MPIRFRFEEIWDLFRIVGEYREGERVFPLAEFEDFNSARRRARAVRWGTVLSRL